MAGGFDPVLLQGKPDLVDDFFVPPRAEQMKTDLSSLDIGYLLHLISLRRRGIGAGIDADCERPTVTTVAAHSLLL